MAGNDGKPGNPLGGANPTGPTGGATRKCATCTITSQTSATVPADQARTKIGIGEEVTLTVDNGPATWSLSGAGKLVPSEGTTVTYTADDSAGSVTITAEGPGCSCTKTFTVVKPESLTMEQIDGTGIHHNHNKPDCGFLGQPWVHPDDVSFTNVNVREMNSVVSGDGYFKWLDKQKHMGPDKASSDWYIVKECVPGKGSPVQCRDMVYGGYTSDPLQAGTLVMSADWQYKVGAGAEHNFPSFEQKHVVEANGQCTTSKGGKSITTKLSDPNSLADPGLKW